MKLRTWFSAGLLLIFALVLMGGSPNNQRQGGQGGGLSKTLRSGDFVVFDANNISTFIRNNGSFDRNPGTGNAGYEWPKGTGNTAIYASGLWLGGKRAGTVRVAVAEYAYEFDAGPIAAGIDPQDDRWRVYKIRRGDNAQTNPDYAAWPVADGAPFNDLNSNGTYEPQNGETPKLIGDMTIWCVFNDNDPNVHTNMNTLPLGMEVQLTAWAFNRSDALGNAIFYKWKFINKSGGPIDSAFVTVWSDPDLGDSGDDFDGCDTTLGLGFVYNSDAIDGVYGSQPPAVGFDFLQGPLVPGAATDTASFPDGRKFPGKKLLKMTSYIKYNNDATDLGNPNSGTEVYNYMKGRTRTGLTLPANAAGGTTFMYSGNPSLPSSTTNLIETGAGGDRRFMMSAGPFTMAAGDTQEIVAANLIAQGADYLNSVVALKNADRAVQTAYNLDFQLAPPPNAPPVVVAELPNQIVLSWGENDSLATVIENTTTLDRLAQAGGATDFTYNFEGYVVYQFGSAFGDLPRVVATYDVTVNPEHPEIPSPGVIYDNVFRPELGGVVNIPVRFGSNSGVRRSIRITKDAYTGQDLSNAKDYYFGVTAYTYNNESVPKTLESAINVLTVRPTRLYGTRVNAAYGDTARGVTHTSGISEATIIPKVINPALLTGHNYQIRIDTAGGTQKWKLRDLTLSTDLLTSTNFGLAQGGTNYSWPNKDGVEWGVYDVETRPNPDSSTFSMTPTTTWLQASRWANVPPAVVDPTENGEGVITTGDDLPNFLGQVASAFNMKNAVPIEVRFGPGINQLAYRMRRVGGRGTQYVIQATNPFVQVPFQVWDVSTPATPRQLTVTWRDNNNSTSFDPGQGAGNDGVEVVFIYFRTYTTAGGQWVYQGQGTDTSAWENAATAKSTADIMYGMAFSLVDTVARRPYVASTIRVVPFKLLKPVDVYTIAGPTAPTRDGSLQKADLAAVQAVPNPYFGASAYERNQFGRVVRFTNLPPNAMVRIFTLAGELVRTFDNAAEGGHTTLDWDLTNRNDIPVASGMYLVHIDAMGVGTKVLKVAVIMTEERLDNF